MITNRPHDRPDLYITLETVHVSSKWHYNIVPLRHQIVRFVQSIITGRTCPCTKMIYPKKSIREDFM